MSTMEEISKAQVSPGVFKPFMGAKAMSTLERTKVSRRLSSGHNEGYKTGQNPVASAGRKIWGSKREATPAGKRPEMRLRAPEVKTSGTHKGGVSLASAQPNGRGGGILHVTPEALRSPTIMSHEMAHITPKRNPRRFAERISRNPMAHAGEEARADYIAHGKLTPGRYGNQDDAAWQARYNEVQNKMHTARQRKVKKSLVNGEFVSAALLNPTERKAMGGYAKLKGRSVEHEQFMRHRQHRLKDIQEHGGAREKYKYGPLRSVKGLRQRLQGKTSGSAYTMRVGSKKGGHSHMYGEGSSKHLMAPTRAHEEAHAMEGRNEFRLHGQIMKDPEKMMREEARADMAPGARGHYGEQYVRTYGSKRHGIKGGEPGRMGGYGAAALHNDPARLQHGYSHLSYGEADRGIKAYKQTQDKILAARGGKDKLIAQIKANPMPKKQNRLLTAVPPRSKNTGPVKLRLPGRRAQGQLQPVPASTS